MFEDCGSTGDDRFNSYGDDYEYLYGDECDDEVFGCDTDEVKVNKVIYILLI